MSTESRELPELPDPAAVLYPDSGFRQDAPAISLWRAHGYDTGGEPFYSADHLHSYAAKRVAHSRAQDSGGEAYPVMRAAFVTSQSCGPDKRYELVFAFRDLDTLQAAHREWIAAEQPAKVEGRCAVEAFRSEMFNWLDALTKGMDRGAVQCGLVDAFRRYATPVAGLEAAVLAAFPMNWCDPLLTGEMAVVGFPPYGCPDIERLITAIKQRVSGAFLAQTAEGVK